MVLARFEVATDMHDFHWLTLTLETRDLVGHWSAGLISIFYLATGGDTDRSHPIGNHDTLSPWRSPGHRQTFLTLFRSRTSECLERSSISPLAINLLMNTRSGQAV